MARSHATAPQEFQRNTRGLPQLPNPVMPHSSTPAMAFGVASGQPAKSGASLPRPGVGEDGEGWAGWVVQAVERPPTDRSIPPGRGWRQKRRLGSSKPNAKLDTPGLRDALEEAPRASGGRAGFSIQPPPIGSYTELEHGFRPHQPAPGWLPLAGRLGGGRDRFRRIEFGLRGPAAAPGRKFMLFAPHPRGHGDGRANRVRLGRRWPSPAFTVKAVDSH